MTTINKYIGIPHHFGQSTFKSCDCIGLAKLFYANEGFTEALDDGLPLGDIDHHKKHPLRMLRYFAKNMKKIKDYNSLQWGDIVVFFVYEEHHVGIYLDHGKVLTMQLPVVYGHTTSTIYRSHYWKHSFVCGFRSKKEENHGNISTTMGIPG